MSENSLRTNRGYLLAAVVMCPLLPSSAVAQSDVSRLLEDTRATATQLSRDVVQMETFTRSKVSWQSHAAQIDRIKTHINNAGKLVAQLQDARGGAAQVAAGRYRSHHPIVKRNGI
ncbi:MAG TPA: hypothetical protein VKV15_13090 [Bryobacteraceae bacterium]|nr:hypothetical protein [Bryobacteraceae bacterium]